MDQRVVNKLVANYHNLQPLKDRLACLMGVEGPLVCCYLCEVYNQLRSDEAMRLIDKDIQHLNQWYHNNVTNYINRCSN